MNKGLYMRKMLLFFFLTCSAYTEILANSEVENIEQLINKKTQVVAKDKSNIIKKGDSPIVNIIQGISESTTIKVHINFKNEPDKPLSE